MQDHHMEDHRMEDLSVQSDEKRRRLLVEFDEMLRGLRTESVWTLGLCLRLGRHLSRDDELALLCCREALRRGYPPALAGLGRLYEQGLGVERDPRAAQNLWRLALLAAAVNRGAQPHPPAPPSP